MIKNTTFNGITLPAISLYSETNGLETVLRLATKITGCVFHNSVIEYVRTLNNLEKVEKNTPSKRNFPRLTPAAYGHRIYTGGCKTKCKSNGTSQKIRSTMRLGDYS